MRKHIVFPTALPERPKDGRGRTYGGNDGHGIVRISLQPPIEKGEQQSWDSAPEEFENDLGMDLGQQLGVQTGENRIGPFRLRFGKHEQYGIVAVAIAVGELTVVATFEMGHPNLAKEDLQAFAHSFANIDIEQNA